MSLAEPGPENDIPSARSRAGDFLFSAMAGAIGIIGALMLGPGFSAVGFVVLLGFLAVLSLRYILLLDAPAVRAGTNVSEKQLETLARLRGLLNALPQPVMLINQQGHVEMCNRACTNMFSRNVVSSHVSSVIRAPQALEVIRMAAASDVHEEAEITLSDSLQERTMLFYAARLGLDGNGDPDAMIVMLRDRTEQKKLERMRTDFVANASHELRTPLTAMAGFIETLQGHARNDPAARERFLEVMASQADRMLRLVEDLIGLSEIELNQMKPLTEEVDLSQVAASVVEMLQPIAASSHCSLRLVDQDDDSIVLGDRHELFRLFQNLCDNAVKYGSSDDGTHKEVEVRIGRGLPETQPDYKRTGETASQVAARVGVSEEQLIHIQIRDWGEGIQPNDLPRLTERFYRVDPQLSRSKGGTGLGLAIVKHILTRHRGGLQIESAKGVGSVFTVLLPGLKKQQNTQAAIETGNTH